MESVLRYEKRNGTIMFFRSEEYGVIVLNLNFENPENKTFTLNLNPGDRVKVELKEGKLKNLGGQPCDIDRFLEKVE